METFLKILGGMVVVVFVICSYSALLSWATMYLVNWLFTPAVLLSLFGTAKLSLLQGFVLNIIVSLLFKSWNVSTNSKS